MNILIVQYNITFSTPLEFEHNLVIYDSICTKFGRLSVVNYRRRPEIISRPKLGLT